MYKPTVSIITATLNRSSLKDACESINNQTFQDWHHYVIGDGITPIDYPHTRRTTIGFSRHIGGSEVAADKPYGTPNPIWRWAVQHLNIGQFFCLLDDDNIYKPRYIETMLTTLFSNPQAGIVLCALEDLRQDAIHDGYPELGRCDTSAFIVRSDIVQKIGIPKEYPNRDAISDYDFIRICADKYGWVRVEEKLVVFGFGPSIVPQD